MQVRQPKGPAMALPPDIQEQIRTALCLPEGSLCFEYSSATAFRRAEAADVLFQVPAGGHLFRLERLEERRLHFYHSSPGTGTRVAAIDLGALPDFDSAFLAFTWSPSEMHFYCGPRIPGTGMLSAKADASPKQFRVGEDGSVFQVGDEGVEVMGVRVREGGKAVLAPTAIEAWRETLKAVDVLRTGKSDHGFLFETAVAAMSLSVLVTGLEAYAKTRFVEVETEGVRADGTETFNVFASKAERESSRLQELQAEADATGQSLLRVIVDAGKVNFQNYDQMKRAFRAAYGIDFGTIGLDSQTVTALKRFIRYRHRIVHVSPLLSFLNGDAVPPEEPVFANQALVEAAVKCFTAAVTALHQATLGLRRVM